MLDAMNSHSTTQDEDPIDFVEEARDEDINQIIDAHNNLAS